MSSVLHIVYSPPSSKFDTSLPCRFTRSDQQLAALRVTSVEIDGEAFEFEKAFPHVTVWKAAKIQAVESNELNAENSQVVELAAPLRLAAVVRTA